MAKKKASRPAPERSPWAAASVGVEDLDVAKREALLQLRIGRVAHLSAIALSAGLTLDALVLLVVQRTVPLISASQSGTTLAGNTFFLIAPIALAVAVAVVALVSKWEAFFVWPWEGHFAANLGALALGLGVAIVYVLRLAGNAAVASLPLYPAFVPLSLLGASVALIGTSATWRPWAAPQWTSAATAAAPVAIALALYWPGVGPAGGTSIGLGVVLLLAAILYQTSGSFLHLVSSGTAPHEQAVVLTGQNRIVRLAGELGQRAEAIRFREAALVKREADAETSESALQRAKEALDDRTGRLADAEGGHQAKVDALATRERDLAGREAALVGGAQAVESRHQQVERRNAELTRTATELSAREQRVAKSEGDLARRDLEFKQRADDLGRREATITDGEARVLARRKEIDQKTAELLRREGEVAARERPLGPGSPTATARPAASGDVAAREARLKTLQAALDEQNGQLGRRAKELGDQAKSLEATLRQIADRQARLAARETALTLRESDLDDRLKSTEERRSEFDTATRDYQQRLQDVGQQQVSAAQKAADLDHRLQEVAGREKSLTEREARLQSARSDLDRREGDVVLRERSVDADEAEVSLRRQEIEREGDLPFAGLLAVAAADRAEGQPDSAVSRAARARRRRPVLGSQETTTAETGTLAPQSGRKYADRLPTGTPRLDDLLLGGFPPKSHVALVGEAFVGKEVALYAFVAEGLKRGEPVLLVTASRSAPEIAEGLGVVVPQFREYEQMGLVTWVDASGSGAVPGPHHLVTKSADDRPGLLTALVQAAKATEETAKGGPFRVGFFGLSAVLAHGAEREGFSFLQNVVGILKPRSALAMYALEAGALSEAQVESLLGRMDGAILFRQDRDRTFLSVKGFGDVATRDWVEVRATKRALIVGSFALERIR